MTQKMRATRFHVRVFRIEFVVNDGLLVRCSRRGKWRGRTLRWRAAGRSLERRRACRMECGCERGVPQLRTLHSAGGGDCSYGQKEIGGCAGLRLSDRHSVTSLSLTTRPPRVVVLSDVAPFFSLSRSFACSVVDCDQTQHPQTTTEDSQDCRIRFPETSCQVRHPSTLTRLIFAREF